MLLQFTYILDLSDGQFIGMYRLSKELVKQLIEMVRPFMKAPSRHGALSIERKVIIFIFFININIILPMSRMSS